MRYVAIAFVLLSLPAFIGLLRSYPQRRSWAFVALGLMLFCGDNLRIDASIVGWPMWNGLARGIEISPVDTLALALMITRGRRPTLLFWWAFALYGASLAISIVPASVPMATFFVWWEYFRVLLIFAAIGGESARPDLRNGLLVGLSLGLMLQAGYVIQQKLSGVVQATGTMYHQNTLGMMTELALLPMIVGLLGGVRNPSLKVGIAAGFIVIAGGGSRAAMGMAFGGIVIVTVLSIIRQVTPTKLKMVGIGALVFAVVIPLGLMTLKDRFGSNSMVTQERERAAFERAATAMAADHPFGVGANLYVPTANLKGYADRAGVAWNFANRSAPVHNAYLLARAETGWAGEVSYMLLLIVPLIAGLRYAFANRRGQAGEIALGSAAAVGVMAFHNNYEYAGLSYSVFSLLMVNCGLIAGQIRQSRMPRQQDNRRLGVIAASSRPNTPSASILA